MRNDKNVCTIRILLSWSGICHCHRPTHRTSSIQRHLLYELQPKEIGFNGRCYTKRSCSEWWGQGKVLSLAQIWCSLLVGRPCISGKIRITTIMCLVIVLVANGILLCVHQVRVCRSSRCSDYRGQINFFLAPPARSSLSVAHVSNRSASSAPQQEGVDYCWIY